jgi:DNA-directed RNA polymerase subunit H (RpoH/RPB5)
MSSQASTTIQSLYKSRVNLLDLLKTQGYNTIDYEEFSVNEVHLMNQKKQLDMLLTSEDGTKKTYIKYHLGKTISRENINDYIDDLYNLDQILTKGDTLTIIIKKEPNDTLISILNQIWSQDGIFIIIYNLERLQFNILNHEYVPKHEIMKESAVEELKKRFNLKNTGELPTISRYDPVAQAIGMRPGEVCKITRSSKTSITTNYYRICSL